MTDTQIDTQVDAVVVDVVVGPPPVGRPEVAESLWDPHALARIPGTWSLAESPVGA